MRIDIRRRHPEYSSEGMYTVHKRNYLQKLYEVDRSTGNYIVEMTVNNYEDIFNDLDNAPLVKKDINQEIKDFLHDCSTDIPVKHKIELYFNISGEKRNETKESQVKAAFKTYCSFYIHSNRKKLKELYYHIAEYTIASIILLFVGFMLEEKMKKGLLCNILVEGFTIGGWVFLWQALSYYLGERKEIAGEIKILRRLLNSPRLFKYRPG